VHFVLDELGQVPLPALPDTLADARGNEVIVVGGLQDLTQAEARWGTKGKTLRSNFRTILALPGIRTEDAKLLSLLIGDYDRPMESWTKIRRRSGFGWEWQKSIKWERTPKVPPSALYAGPSQPDSTYAFVDNSWGVLGLNLYFKTWPWPSMIITSCTEALRDPEILKLGLPLPDLAENGDTRFLGPELAGRWAEVVRLHRRSQLAQSGLLDSDW
jgi:hypothetical protein